MKLIHCSDLHLDSQFTAHYSPEQAARHRARLLHTFLRMTDYARDEDVEAILLCGDIFDTQSVRPEAVRAVEQAVRRSPGVLFFYLCGNHDPRCPLFEGEETPENLILAGREWTGYTLRSRRHPRSAVRITGLSWTGQSPIPALRQLSLSPSAVNIVLLHGTVTAGSAGAEDSADHIPLPLLKGKGIDYLALGHLHAPAEGRIDGRGVYVYPGCLEGRGYDECGDKGFMLLEVTPGRGLDHRFIPFAGSRIHDLETDCTGCTDTWEIARRMRAVMEKSGCGRQDLVRMTLTGEADPDCTPDRGILCEEGASRCSDFELVSRLHSALNPEAYLGDLSLRGEFVRAVLADSALPQEEADAVIRCGLRALDGEEVLL